MIDLKEIAQERVFSDCSGDVVIDDWAGGNVDDAYYIGVRAGRTELAREILDEQGIEYEIEED